MHEKPRGFVSMIRPTSSELSDCVLGDLIHICSIMVSVSVILFEAGASDFVSHTSDFNTCCMYRDLQVV